MRITILLLTLALVLSTGCCAKYGTALYECNEALEYEYMRNDVLEYDNDQCMDELTDCEYKNI